jgi:RNA polymerase sigma-70 factor (ECF subfamily)
MIDEPGGRAETSELALLLRHAKAGDVAAFEQILVLHDRRVFLTALRLLGSVEDAQDASQEVFLRLHKHLRRFDDSRAFGPWLYRVTVNVCRDLARRRRTDVRLDSVELQEPAVQTDQYDREEQRRIVRLALGKLPHKERAALVLRDIEGLATGEVARILGSSEATVRSQVSSARVKVKRFADRFLGRVR